jgi:nucleotide-binding universal stress UspA family protein
MTVSIVAVLTDPATARACLAAAATAARAVSASGIEAFHPRIRPGSMIMPSEEVMTKRRRGELETMLEGRSAALHQVFDAWAETVAPTVSAVWNEVEADTVAASVAARSKLADLLVLARPEEADGEVALQAAIFETGRLLLLVPSTAGASPGFGRHVAIAWKASDQAGRTVTAAIPWLKHAARVSVLEADAPASPTHDDAFALLGDHGIAAAPVPVEHGTASVADALLRRAHAIGADCLVMGAYRHSRLREAVLGCVTRDMLKHADLPLFMRH